ncbi:hypothetical protein ACFXGA_06205 [Actinosynnema sp. NPDC059335]|uniref:hypothetical protein n=1 Tax=Actinosynnema sp. NPDC059335 TaxID=3346804 RepID=UPI00366EA397
MASETSPRRVAAALRAVEVLKLRAQGLTLDEVAERTGYAHRGSVSKVIRAALQRVGREEARDLFDLDMHRLDLMMQTYLPRALDGDEKAAAIVLKIIDEHRQVLGWGQEDVVRGLLAPPSDDESTDVGPRRLEDVFGKLTPDAQLAIAGILHGQMQLTNAHDADDRPAIVNGTVTNEPE